MMEIFFIVTKQKNNNENAVIYYFDINTINIDHEVVGILQIDLDLFNHYPKNSNRVSFAFSIHEAKK